MKALTMSGYGSNDVVSLTEMPRPIPGPRDVLVEVYAASINPIDFKIRDGKLRMIRRVKFPAIIGHDVSGVVVEIGTEVTRFKRGDAVYARRGKDHPGTIAEYAMVDERHCSLKPRQASMVEAAAVPLAALTSWQVLHEDLKISHNTRLMIPAGAGGVGCFAIQLAKIAGAEVLTTASGVGLNLVKSLGADIVIDYKRQRFEDYAKDLDAIFDTLGGDSLTRSFRVLRRGGRICSIAALPEPNTADQMGAGLRLKALFWLISYRIRAMAARYGVRYSYLFMRPDGEQLSQLAQLIDEGKLRIVVDKVFAFSEAKEALIYLESGRAKGKVVIKIRE